MSRQRKNSQKKERGWVRPAVAVLGFFVILFLAAYLLYRFHFKWLIPVGIAAAFLWAIIFSMDREKDPEKDSEKNKDEASPGEQQDHKKGD